MGPRLVVPHPIISAPRARPSNGSDPSTVGAPRRRFTNRKSGARAALAAMRGSARTLLSGRAPERQPTDLKREAWLPAEPASGAAARSIVSEAAADVGLDAERAWELVLATSEAFANAVQHGKPWPNECILLSTEPCAQGLRVEVTDCGNFDSQLEPAALDATSGRGVQIIAAIVDRLEVQNGNGRTLVRFEKHTAGA